MPSLLDPTITNPGYSQYVADGINDTFLVGYEYADRTSLNPGDVSQFLVVRVNGSDVTYTVASDGTLVVLDDVPADQDEVEVFRDSDFENFLLNWANKTPITQDSLKRMGSQMIWLIQENLQRVRYLRDQFAVFIDASDLVQAAADLFTQFETEIATLEADLAALETLFDVTAPTDSQMLIYDTDAFKNTSISGDFTLDSDAVVTIRPNVVGTTELADNAIVTSKIKDQAVTFVKLAADTIFFIEFGGIAASQLSDLSDVTLSGQLDGDLLVYDTIGATFRNQAISGDFSLDEAGVVTISDNSVTNVKLGDLSVSASKILDDAVTSAKIAAGAITPGKIGANAVDSNNIVNKSVTGDKIALNTIRTENINNNSIINAKIVAGTITGDKVVAQGITGAKIAQNTITFANLASEVSESIGEPNTLYNIVAPQTDDFLIYDGAAFKNVPLSGDAEVSGGSFTIPDGAIDPVQLSFKPVEITVDGQCNIGGRLDLDFRNDGEVIIGSFGGGAKDGMNDSRTVLSIRTTDATPTDMTPTLSIPDSDTWLFFIRITARDEAGADFWSSAWHGHISREGASTIGTSDEDNAVPSNKPAGWDAQVIINDSTDELQIEVTGAAATDINWCATVERTRTIQ